MGSWHLSWSCQHQWGRYIRCFMHPCWSHIGKAPGPRGGRSRPRLSKWRENWSMKCERSWIRRLRGDSCFIWWIGWAMDRRNAPGSRQRTWSTPKMLWRASIACTLSVLRQGTSLHPANDLFLPPHAPFCLQLPPIASSCLFRSFGVEGTTCHGPHRRVAQPRDIM